MRLPPEVQETIPNRDISMASLGPKLAAAVEHARDHGITTTITDHHDRPVAVIAPTDGK